MITQYDAVAEIEAMKWRRVRRPKRNVTAETEPESAARPQQWEGATEAAIRTEMERRFARRRLKGRPA